MTIVWLVLSSVILSLRRILALQSLVLLKQQDYQRWILHSLRSLSMTIVWLVLSSVILSLRRILALQSLVLLNNKTTSGGYFTHFVRSV